ncbi:MAG TPA: DUF2336 domain-containing protein [Xanthobacteraceae bacterium]|nr:DUF2336 domain-containing protein [Xanthobacteraceae bacterium]
MKARQELISELERAISRRSMTSRAASLQDVTDLFVGRADSYTEEQIALFDDVISRLAAEIELSARVQLARVLAPISNAPRNVIHFLAFDDAIEVAAPVLMQSVRLDEAALVENARTKSQSHLLAISHREAIGEAVTDVLVERGDKIVVLSTVRNAGAKFSDRGFSLLVQHAGEDDNIAMGVGSRVEIPRHHFLKLLTVASEQVRIKLEQANPQAASDIRRVVREVTVRTQANSIEESFEYSKALQNVENLMAEGALQEHHVNTLAGAGKFEETVVTLSHLAGVTIAVAERALLQERTELLLSLLKSAGLTWPTVKSVLQLRSKSRPMTADEVEQCLAAYERLKPQTAQLVVRFHSKTGGPAA